jgi:DNA-nicking Smr family endonuclease
MKRSHLIPELEPPLRRKRLLSEEERALWESVAKQIKPLRKRPRPAKASEEVVPPAARPIKMPPSPRPVKADPTSKSNPPPPSAPPLVRIGRRERSQLSRGRKEIDARIDLHGMTQTRAHRALSDFLRRAHADGLTFVLVITGKGRSGENESERGVLRRQVPQWLSLPEFRSLVVGFEEAHIGHGGEGALYVRIRRVRM